MKALMGSRLKVTGSKTATVNAGPMPGRFEDWEALSSVFDFPEREPDFTERVKKRIASIDRRAPKGNIAMVTHNVNIAALTRASVAPAEIVVVEAQGCCGLRVLGRLQLAAQE